MTETIWSFVSGVQEDVHLHRNSPSAVRRNEGVDVSRGGTARGRYGLAGARRRALGADDGQPRSG